VSSRPKADKEVIGFWLDLDGRHRPVGDARGFAYRPSDLDGSRRLPGALEITIRLE